MAFTVPSNWEWFVTVIDRQGFGERQQDVTPWVDMTRSDFKPTTSDKTNRCRMFLSFPIDTPNLNIRELMEVWAGWRDTTSKRPLKAWFGGYIQKQVGSVDGGEHTLDIDLMDYGLLLTGTQVRGWPTLPPGLEVIPPGLTIAEWIEGGGANPYPGLIGMHLQFVATRVGNELADFVIPAWAMPGNADNYPGRWGYVSLRKILEDLVDVMRFIDGAVRPAFWMRAITAGGRVVPQLNFSDQSLISETPRIVFAVNPGPGEAYIEMPFTHERDASTVRTRVTVKGIGGVTEAGPLVEATTYLVNHASQYPTYYQIERGWAGAPIVDARVDTVDKAQRIADAIETQQWGALGAVTFMTDEYVEPGWYVTVRDPIEFGGSGEITQAVAEVNINLNPGRPLFQVRIGRSPIDLNDILRGGTTDQPILEGDAGFRTGGAGVSGTPAGRAGGASAPGNPRNSQAPITRVATHDNQNTVLPQYNDVTGWTLVATPHARPDPLTGLPPTSPPDPSKPLGRVIDSLGNRRDWYGPDGSGHPHHYVIPIMTTDSFPFMIPDPCRLVALKLKNPDGSPASISVALALNGVPQANPSPGTPLVCTRYDVLTVTPSGTVPSTGVAMLLSEAADVPIPSVIPS